MVLLISYDLNGHERPSAYQAIKRAIEAKATSWVRPLYSQWLVETVETPTVWSDYLESNRVIDRNDRLLIARMSSQRQGWLTKQDWEWLNSKVL